MNIDDFSPCISCKSKTCGLMDGNECDKYNKFLKDKRILKTIINDIQTYNMHAKHTLSINEHNGVVDLQVGTRTVSQNLTIAEAHYLVMGMLCEQMESLKPSNTKMTHFEEIKQMSVEEMAGFIARSGMCEGLYGVDCITNCTDCMCKWLESEVETE